MSDNKEDIFSSSSKYSVDDIIEEYDLKKQDKADKIKQQELDSREENKRKQAVSDEEAPEIMWEPAQLDGYIPEDNEGMQCVIEDIPVSEELRNKEPVNDDVIYSDEEESSAIIGGADRVTFIELSKSDEKEHERISFKSRLLSLLPQRGDSAKEIIRKVIFLSAMAVLIYGSVVLLSTFIQSRLAIADQQEIKDHIMTEIVTGTDSNGNIITVEPTDEQALEHSRKIIQYYKDINPDVRGFITIENCNIYMPVVQGEDNDYYLTHTYKKTVNKAGSIFMDYRCKISEDYVSPNIVIHGHNQKDGTMFGNLKEYKKNAEYYKKYPIIEFDTEYGIGKYVIYSCFVTSVLENQDRNGEVFHYHDYIEVLNDEYTFNWYIDQINQRNEYITPVDVKYGDKLLTLSTCSDEFSNLRFVVCARKLRDGETAESFDFSSVELNPDAKTIDFYAITSNVTTYPQTAWSDISEDTSDTEETSSTDISESIDTVTETMTETEQEQSETTAPTETEKEKPKTTAPPETQTEQQTTETVSADDNG